MSNVFVTQSEAQPAQLRAPFTALVLVAELAHLGWEYVNGGVLSHNVLNNPDLPAISNWWGLLVLPVFAWIMTGFIQKRITASPAASALPARIVAGFVGALLTGILFSVLFRGGYEDVLFYLLLGIIAFGTLAPLYRAEYGLGFVLGMTFVFGAVLPMIVGAVLMAMSWVVHRVIRPAAAMLWTRLKRG